MGKLYNNYFVLVCLATPFTIFSSKFNDLKIFFHQAYNNFQTVGAFAPISRNTAQAINNFINKKIQKEGKTNIRLLEVGAGTGSLSEHFFNFLNNINIDYNLDLVEINAKFCKLLSKKFKKYPQINIHCNDIILYNPSDKYDVIISTLPFNNSFFSPTNIQQILNKYEEIIKEDGLIIYVEYILIGKINRFFLNKDKKEAYDLKHEILDQFKKKHITIKYTIFTNLPPLYIYQVKIKK